MKFFLVGFDILNNFLQESVGCTICLHRGALMDEVGENFLSFEPYSVVGFGGAGDPAPEQQQVYVPVLHEVVEACLVPGEYPAAHQRLLL